MRTVDLKLRTVTIDGEQRVEPETMALLIEFADHRQACDDCEEFFKKMIGTYCATGLSLMQQIIERPDVEVVETTKGE